MKNLLIIIVILSFLISTVRPQSIPTPKGTPSPGTLSGLINSNIDFNSGILSTKLPIHSFNYKGIDLEMSISYNGGGVKIDQHPGYVGQNWSFNFGGQVSRTINGLPDELTFSGTNFPIVNNPDKGYFFHPGIINGGNYCNYAHLKSLALDSQNPFGNYSYEYEPDIFSFNFLNFSGKFVMGNDGRFKVISEDNLLIIYENELINPLFEDFPEHFYNNWKYPKVIPGFKIIDGQGTTYIFGYTENSIEYSIDFFRQSSPISPDYWKAITWNLTKIIDKFGTTVYEINYERGHFIASFYKSDYWSKWNYDGGGNLINPAPNCSNSTSSINSQAVQGNLISPVYPKNVIYAPNNSVLAYFEYSLTTELEYDIADWQEHYTQLANDCNNAGLDFYFYYLESQNPYIFDANLNYYENLKWRKLDNVIVNGGQRYKFVYNNSPSERLNLEKLELVSNDWPSGQGYQTISYNFYYNHFEKLPKYLSQKDDHWGFYKGACYSFNPILRSTFYNSREAHQDSLIIGVLTSIKQPTGGYSVFEYEPHTYSKIISADGGSLYSETGIGGGVRISKTYSVNDGIIYNLKKYKYITGYDNNQSDHLSSGILSFKPRYYWSEYNVAAENGGYYSKELFSINQIIPFSNYLGNIISYSEIIEQLEDESYTVYKYNDFENELFFDEPPCCNLSNSVSPYVKRTSHSLFRNKLKSKSVFDKDGSIIRLEEFDYTNSVYENFAVYASNTVRSQACPESAESYFEGTSYKIYFIDYNPYMKTIYNYTKEGSALVNVIKYDFIDNNISNNVTYGNVRSLRELTTINSNIIKKVIYEYPFDFSNYTVMNEMTKKFMIDIVTSKSEFLEVDGVDKPIGLTRSLYRITNGSVVPDQVLTSSTDESNLKREIHFDVYSTDGLLLQYTKLDNHKISVLWDNLHSRPKAIINNVDYNQVAQLNYQHTEINSLDLWTAINNEVQNCLALTYSYNTIGDLKSTTDHFGVTKKYEYDIFNRLKGVRNKHNEFHLFYDYNYTYE